MDNEQVWGVVAAALTENAVCGAETNCWSAPPSTMEADFCCTWNRVHFPFRGEAAVGGSGRGRDQQMKMVGPFSPVGRAMAVCLWEMVTVSHGKLLQDLEICAPYYCCYYLWGRPVFCQRLRWDHSARGVVDLPAYFLAFLEVAAGSQPSNGAHPVQASAR